MIIKLRDRNQEMADAWREVFGHEKSIQISSGDIFDERADAIVSPANSFGFMDGGIDLAYSEFFGWDLQNRLQDKLKKEHFGELPVGQAVIVATNYAEIPYLISSPTMRIPQNVSNTVNAYLAFRAALQAVQEQNQHGPIINSLLCPGLGTAVGKLDRRTCARQMYYAYCLVVKGEIPNFATLGMAKDTHYAMLR